MSERKSSSNVESVLVVVIGFIIFFILYQNIWLIRLGLLAGLLGLFSKKVAASIGWILGKITYVLGWINTRVLLSILFLLILFPIAILYRWSKKDFLHLKKTTDSMYKVRNHKYTVEDLENTW